jgi:hypothetical protein
MIATSNRDPSPTREYAQLLQQLHALLAEDKGDSVEAEAIREAMDAPGMALDRQERERMNGLSEDLYALAEGGARSVLMSPAEQQDWARNLQEAFHAKAWDRALELLRHSPLALPPGAVPLLQAKCWKHLGDTEVALRFQREAERIDPACGAVVRNGSAEDEVSDLLALCPDSPT